MPTFRAILEHGAIEASAPCRIDMGGTLDLSAFYLPLHHLEPCTFNAALNLRTHVRLSAFQPGRIKISSRGFDSLVVQSDKAPFDHPMGLMCAVAAYFQADGVHVEIHSSSPPRSALGGSSVAAVAMIWAFFKARAKSGGAMPAPKDVAALAHAIEQSVAGVPCGMQDQLAAVFGGVNGWHWKGVVSGPQYDREPLISAGDCPDFSRHVMVAYCGVPHVSKDINGAWVRGFIGGDTREIWRQIADCSRRFIRSLASGDYEQARDLMNLETDLRCRLTPEVLDDMGMKLVHAARAHLCGARFTGAGGGGCLWALGQPERIEQLRPVWAQILTGRQTARILETAVDAQGLL